MHLNVGRINPTILLIQKFHTIILNIFQDVFEINVVCILHRKMGLILKKLLNLISGFYSFYYKKIQTKAFLQKYTKKSSTESIESA